MDNPTHDKPKRSRPLVTSIKIMTPGVANVNPETSGDEMLFSTSNSFTEYEHSLSSASITMTPSAGGNQSPPIVGPFSRNGDKSFKTTANAQVTIYLNGLKSQGVNSVDVTVDSSDNFPNTPITFD